MPAVDPARLSREIQTLIMEFEHPAELVDRVLSLLEFYADRVSRPGAHAAIHAPQRAFSAPAPVVNSLRLALGREAAARPDPAWEIADRLWAIGYHETYLLAAAVVEAQTDPHAAAWVDDRLDAGLDDRLRELLASSAWRGWRTADPQGFLALAEAWTRGKDATRQSFGFMALRAAVLDRPSEILAPMIDLLYRLPSGRAMAGQAARLELLKALADDSPAEIAAYLLHEYERGSPGSERDLNQLLDRFPVDLQARLRSSLRG